MFWKSTDTDTSVYSNILDNVSSVCWEILKLNPPKYISESLTWDLG